ncbi:MAG: RHS repeat-associated core domain-containing protein [Acidimicrobiales bacterium]
MGQGHSTRSRRALAGFLTLSFVVGVVMADGAPVAADVPDWLADLLPSSPDDDPSAPPMEEARSAPLASSEGVEPAEASLPEPGSDVVTLGGLDDPPAETADGALALESRTEAVAGERLQVEVLEQTVVQQAGIAGFAFRISGVTQPLGQLAGGEAFGSEVVVDYSGFAEAYGAGYEDRLAVVALPACALEDPRPEGCQPAGVPLPMEHDWESRRLIVEIDDLADLASNRLEVGSAADAAEPAVGTAPESAVGPGSSAAGESVVLAVTAGPSGETGNFGASALSSSGDWDVGIGSGEFNWSYPIEIPEPPYGSAPSVGLSYSSGAVDGLVSTRNTQGPAAGIGWSDFASAFIERRYVSCADTVDLNDLCWHSSNATISLNGLSSELIATNSSGMQWRLQQDPGWRVERGFYTVANGDNDREYWKVTMPDGTQYFFGLGQNPDTAAATNSVWTVPVYADHTGEPCRGAGNTFSGCVQAWRWNLDRVVDTNGIVTTYTYEKETNSYLALGGFGNISAPYDRAGTLAKIEYGVPTGSPATFSPAGRVTFNREYRCASLNSSCTAPTASNGTSFPDVPNDLICSSNCLVTTPTFFTGRRYASVLTEVRVGGAWRPVDRTILGHSHLTNGDGHKKMYLMTIQREGRSQGGTLRLPNIAFLPTELPNRVDVNAAAGKTPMGHFRVGAIVDEYGQVTAVTYGQPNSCPVNKTGPWDQNIENCFPQKLGATFGVFHRYVTTRVEEIDSNGGSPTMTTVYTYEGDPAWHHTDDEFTPLADQSWSSWRGYGTVKVTLGTTATRYRVFRGMHGDRLSVGGPRTAQVASLVQPSLVFNDEPWLAGMVLEEAQLGIFGDVQEAARYEYEPRVTSLVGTDPQDWGVWVGTSRTTSSIATAVNVFRQQRTTTTFTPHLQPATVLEEGWLDATGDERCTTTTYAINDTAWILDRPSSVKMVGGSNCAAGQELRRSETYYDLSTTLGVAPSRGNPTRHRMQLDASTWATEETRYDAWGRVMSVADANEGTSTTGYEFTPNGGFPQSTVATNAKGHVTVTQWLPEYGEPLSVTDPNDRVTSYTYNSLGLLTSVRLPTEQPVTSGPASHQFSYQIATDKSKPPIVRSRTLQSTSPERYEDAWVLFDSSLRERQTQRLSPVSGRVLVDMTTYDEQGLVKDETVPQAVVGTPGQGFLTPATWDNRTRTTYDPLGRVSRVGWYRDFDDGERWTTLTTYTADTTTVDHPEGRRTRTAVDGLDRVVSQDEWDGTAWRSTSYGYDLAGDLLSITDPAGNIITYTYNRAGWKVTADDPDAGASSYGYDLMGNQTTVTDALGGVLFTAYDQINRPTERRQGGSTGTVLATWEYDATGEKGLLNRSTRVTGQGNWVNDVPGYDARSRPLGESLTVPAGIPGLSNSYTTEFGYDRADHLTSITYPAVAGLPAETVTTTYNSIGLPETLVGADEYVWAASYDDRARPSSFGLGPRPGGDTWMGKNWIYDGDQRLGEMSAFVDGQTTSHQFGYDDVGNLTERTSELGIQGGWRECFEYDDRQRLVEAFTTAIGANCGTGTPGTGDQPYEHSYVYSHDGNLVQRTEDDEVYDYTYPTGTNPDRPHAPTAVEGDTYTWDANGNLDSRVVDDETQDFSWDAEHRLVGVSGPGGANSFVYDPDGQRLLRTTPAGSTLYFAGHEMTASTSGSFVTAVRSYSFGGQLVATRSTTNGVEYLISDQQGSVEASAPAGEELSTTRTYEPFGEERSAEGETTTDQGWIGQIEDPSLELSYLNARYYDAKLGRFISPDPIYDRANPQSLNPYSYGLNSPTVNADPSGLKAGKAMGGGGKAGGGAKWLFIQWLKKAGKQAAYSERRHQRNSWKHWRKGKAAQRDASRKLGRAMEAAARKKRAQDITTLKAMHATGAPTALWEALRSAGSAKALIAIAKQIQLAEKSARFHKIAEQVGQGRGGAPTGILGYVGRDGRFYRPGWPWDGPVDWVEEQGENFVCQLHAGGRPSSCGSVEDPVKELSDIYWNPSPRYCAAVGVAGTANGAANTSVAKNFAGNRSLQAIGSADAWLILGAASGGCIKEMIKDTIGMG